MINRIIRKHISSISFESKKISIEKRHMNTTVQIIGQRMEPIAYRIWDTGLSWQKGCLVQFVALIFYKTSQKLIGSIIRGSKMTKYKKDQQMYEVVKFTIRMMFLIMKGKVLRRSKFFLKLV